MNHFERIRFALKEVCYWAYLIYGMSNCLYDSRFWTMALMARSFWPLSPIGATQSTWQRWVWPYYKLKSRWSFQGLLEMILIWLIKIFYHPNFIKKIEILVLWSKYRYNDFLWITFKHTVFVFWYWMLIFISKDK